MINSKPFVLSFIEVYSFGFSTLSSKRTLRRNLYSFDLSDLSFRSCSFALSDRLLSRLRSKNANVMLYRFDMQIEILKGSIFIYPQKIVKKESWCLVFEYSCSELFQLIT
jgi:hypothetical protein